MIFWVVAPCGLGLENNVLSPGKAGSVLFRNLGYNPKITQRNNPENDNFNADHLKSIQYLTGLRHQN